MTQNNGQANRPGTGRRLGPGPYLVVGAIWLGLAHAAARFKTVEPVYLWILTQGLLLEKVSGSTRWLSELTWLVAYATLALVAWRLFEKPGADRSRWWTRAVIAWFAIQIAYAATAALLVGIGVLYE